MVLCVRKLCMLLGRLQQELQEVSPWYVSCSQIGVLTHVPESMGASAVPTLKVWMKKDSGLRDQEMDLHGSLGWVAKVTVSCIFSLLLQPLEETEL